MTDVRDAWHDLLAALREAGYDAAALARPPAGTEQVAAAEAAIGRSLPPELVELYLVSDGQVRWDGRARAEADTVRGRWTGPVFGAGWEFDDLDRLVTGYRVWADVREPLTPEELAENFDEAVEVRGDDPVEAVYTHEAWVPFATDGGGNSLAVDLAPRPGGRVGQVIVIGSDEDLRRVVAPGVLALLRLCADRVRHPVADLYVSDGIAMYELEATAQAS